MIDVAGTVFRLVVALLHGYSIGLSYPVGSLL